MLKDSIWFATIDELAPDLRAVFAASGPLNLALCFTCYSFNYIGVIGFLPTILVDLARIGPTAASLLTALAVADVAAARAR